MSTTDVVIIVGAGLWIIAGLGLWILWRILRAAGKGKVEPKA